MQRRLIEATRGMHYHVTRGFVGEVTCTDFEWRIFAPDILAAHPVTLVHLTSVPHGPQWDDHAATLDPESDTWEFVNWPGVRFDLPHAP